MAQIGNVDKQIGFADFFQCRFERFNQCVRKFSQKAHSVRKQDALFVRQNEAARRRIQRGKKLVLSQQVCSGEQIQQRRFAGVRVTDHRSDWPLVTFAALSLDSTRFAHRFQFALESRDSFLHTATIDFQLRLTRTACADASRLARQVMPHSSQARQKILQLGEFNL